MRRADDARLIGPGSPAESYLSIERILAAARASGAEAIHPGYGFLAENAGFARACDEAGIVWIGPAAAAIEAMGSKIESRRRMAAAGVPVVPGTTERVTTAEQVVALGDSLGWPIAIKASAGGGGRGLKVVRGPGEAERALASAEREGEAYFADGAVYVERYIDDPRHVEIQVLADQHGSVIHLGERDCTLQRRHQKVVEESPSPAVDDELRERMGAMAVAAARAVGYVSAGTVECLVDPQGEFFFLEMNTRIQVEHSVTELVTGVDLVRAQIEIAAGAPLELRQEDVRLRGHAFECRVNAEDAGSRVPAGTGTHHALPRAGRPGRARRLGHRGGRRGRRPVRPDDREAARLGRRPPARDRAHAARARRVRDRGRADAAAAAPADLRPPGVPGRRDVRGPRRGSAGRASSRPPGPPRPPCRPRSPVRSTSSSTDAATRCGCSSPSSRRSQTSDGAATSVARRAAGPARAASRSRARCREPCSASRCRRVRLSNPARCSS